MSVVVSTGKVVTLSYILSDDQGRTIEERTVENPIIYLHGQEQILPTLERALEGQTPGYAAIVNVDVRNGFGEYKSDLVMELPRDRFPETVDVVVGMKFYTTGPDGLPCAIRVIEVEQDHIVVDGNHPLAGLGLTFDVRILKVRDATDAEIESGEVDEIESPGLH